MTMQLFIDRDTILYRYIKREIERDSCQSKLLEGYLTSYQAESSITHLRISLTLIAAHKKSVNNIQAVRFTNSVQ